MFSKILQNYKYLLVHHLQETNGGGDTGGESLAGDSESTEAIISKLGSSLKGQDLVYLEKILDNMKKETESISNTLRSSAQSLREELSGTVQTHAIPHPPELENHPLLSEKELQNTRYYFETNITLENKTAVLAALDMPVGDIDDPMYVTQLHMHVKDFQKSNGLTVDGYAGKKTLAKIEAARPYSVKYFEAQNTGDQTMIESYVGKVDGTPESIQRITEFQVEAKEKVNSDIIVDGILGDQTFGALLQIEANAAEKEANFTTQQELEKKGEVTDGMREGIEKTSQQRYSEYFKNIANTNDKYTFNKEEGRLTYDSMLSFFVEEDGISLEPNFLGSSFPYSEIEKGGIVNEDKNIDHRSGIIQVLIRDIVAEFENNLTSTQASL